ncbi:MAG: PAS domain S-box protein [Candidatus Abyssobacteria bacterium SURF_5]|uniref:histidine kinase n=1 Tax=Abyssobacteria bacterium (strain SURF_5) TaxID=2093360 RepID=A0A3A4P0T6_ABYX5|nr:MAG: PAS domain S-box protein [Candidatus Abyssubacteria bacterium SURF_5]
MSEPEWQKWLRTQLFDQVPCNIAIIDRKYTIVDHNRNFAELFGEGKGFPCYQVYKGRLERCSSCMAAHTFQDGKIRINDEVGVDRYGRPAHYIVHIAPIFGKNGDIPYLIEMSTDVTETKRLQREYQNLFERVPCFVAVLNRDFRVVRANERFRETFGETTGQRCYEVFKRRSEKCEDCPAELTFQDGRPHSGSHIGINKEGNPTYYYVTTTALARGGPNIPHIIEMALDVTEVHKLEDELERSHAFQKTLIENSVDGVIATDAQGQVIIFNPAAKSMLKYGDSDLIGRPLPPEILKLKPEDAMAEGQNECILPETTAKASDGEEIPVRLSCITLRKGTDMIGTALFLQDLRKIKQLEKEKIDAERLAAVGQTVAGLAHGIKNILTGLEGGMYVVNSGLQKGQQDKVDVGWGMLKRNISRISSLVKNLLNFSKGRTPHVTIINPNDIVRDIISLYEDAAKQDGIKLVADTDEAIAPAPFDSEEIHTCLANLVSNALDACQMSEKMVCSVVIRCRDENGSIVFEVADEGAGMDYEIKQKVFTNFFTTKGSGGTGIGLLLTRKIVQEHGGRISVESTPGEGSLFRLIFPRDRLPQPAAEGAAPQN